MNIEDIKRLNLDIIWEKTNEYIGISKPISETFNVDSYVYLIEKNGNIYIKMDDDTDNEFIIPFTENDFKTLTRKTGKEVKKTNFLTYMREKYKLGNKDVEIEYKNLEYYFVGFATDLAETENNMLFNPFIETEAIRQGTAIYIKDKDINISAFRTKYSQSIIIAELHIQFRIKYKNTYIYPLFVAINFFDDKLPIDVKAALYKTSLYRTRDEILNVVKLEDELFKYIMFVMDDSDKLINKIHKCV